MMEENQNLHSIEVTAFYSNGDKLFLSSLTDCGAEFALKISDGALWDFRKAELINITGFVDKLESTELCYVYEYTGTLTGSWVESFDKPVKTLATVLSSLSNAPCKLLRVQRQINRLANERMYESGRKDGYEKGLHNGRFQGVIGGVLGVLIFKSLYLIWQHIF